MAKRTQRGPTDQRRITLPIHLWDLLDEVAKLQSEANKLMAGKTLTTPSEIIESGVVLYLRDLDEELGELPKTPEARKVFVRKLAESNAKRLHEELYGSKTKNH